MSQNTYNMVKIESLILAHGLVYWMEKWGSLVLKTIKPCFLPPPPGLGRTKKPGLIRIKA